MKTMTIRNIPDEVAAWLSGQAGEHHTSINQATVAILTSAAFPAKTRKRRDVSALFGTWSNAEARQFNKTIEDAFEKVDPADWKVMRTR